MNESSPPCDQRCITESNVKSQFKRCALRPILNLVVSDIDLSLFRKMFYEPWQAYEKARFPIL